MVPGGLFCPGYSTVTKDVGIAEQKKVGKQGGDDSIKQFSIQHPYILLFVMQLYKKTR